MKTATNLDERELDGIWFLSTFLTFGYGIDDERNPLKVKNITFVQTDDTTGFSQVNVALESGEVWRVEVEQVS